MEVALQRFAANIAHAHQADRVLLFGSRARGDARPDSDYDVIIISPRYRDIERRSRARDVRRIWYNSEGVGPMDVICLTPEEFEQAQSRISLVAAVLPEAIDLLPLTPAESAAVVRSSAS